MDQIKLKINKPPSYFNKGSKIKWHYLGLFFGKYHQLNNLSLKGTYCCVQTKIPSFLAVCVFQTWKEKKLRETGEREQFRCNKSGCKIDGELTGGALEVDENIQNSR